MFSRVRDLLLARSVRGPAVLADVSMGGRTTDRQHLNFTGKGEDSQAGGLVLWINKSLNINEIGRQKPTNDDGGVPAEKVWI